MGWLQWLRAFHAGPLSGLHRWPKECFALYCGPPHQAARRLGQPFWLYRADPFLIRHQQRWWLFYEEYQYLRNKGRIGACPLDEQGRPAGRHRVVLDLPYHVSYPHVFAADGQLWMVPESRANGTVDLFRAVAFPERWERVCTLLRADACDSTLFRGEDRWWLFTAVAEAQSRYLALFASPRLDSEHWTPHPVNAQRLYRDLPNGSARPGGAIFQRNGELYRLSQWNPDYYGQGTRLTRILRLTPEEFVEEPAPSSDLPTALTHHLCLAPELLAFDRRERISYLPWQRPRPAGAYAPARARNSALVSSNSSNVPEA